MEAEPTMKYATIGAEKLADATRLDCGYFLSPANQLLDLLSTFKARGRKMVQLGGPNGIAKVWSPQRFRREYAAPGEPSAPYLRPYDLFNYIPRSADSLSLLRTRNIADYQITTGMILQTCSGRNLGPATIVDAYLEEFLLSHDMVRIEISNKVLRYYTLAFLNSDFGRLLIRRDKSGSVIDHISDKDVARIEIPLLSEEVVHRIARMMEEAVQLKQTSRIGLRDLVNRYEEMLPQLVRQKPPRMGWSVLSQSIVGRLDAAYYDEFVTAVRHNLLDLGGIPLGSVADVQKPQGRYKTRYVDKEHGRPLLSGSQLMQATPVNLQYMSSKAFKDARNYELRAGWIAYPADGRAEEELGTPVIITADRDGWLASGHVGRVIPNPGVDAGWLYLALATSHAQIQLKATASGSVVDSTFSWDMEGVLLPPVLGIDGTRALELWAGFAHAKVLEDEASFLLDNHLRQ